MTESGSRKIRLESVAAAKQVFSYVSNPNNGTFREMQEEIEEFKNLTRWIYEFVFDAKR